VAESEQLQANFLSYAVLATVHLSNNTVLLANYSAISVGA